MPKKITKGIKVAQLGRTTAETDDRKLNFNSGLNTFKYVKAVRLKSPSNTGAPILPPNLVYDHNLGYPPSFIIYTLGSDGTVRNPDGNSLGAYSDNKVIGMSIAGSSVATVEVLLLVGADDLNDPNS